MFMILLSNLQYIYGVIITLYIGLQTSIISEYSFIFETVMKKSYKKEFFAIFPYRVGKLLMIIVMKTHI